MEACGFRQIRLKMDDVDLSFVYSHGAEAVYGWWTDLSGEGYVGKSLKSVEPMGKDGEKILVKTKWRIMKFNMVLRERLTLDPPAHWIWEPHMMGIDITDDFRLELKGEQVVLRIRSYMKPKGMRGKTVQLMLGWYLKKMMIDEWKSADQAFRREVKI